MAQVKVNLDPYKIFQTKAVLFNSLIDNYGTDFIVWIVWISNEIP